MFFLFPVYSLTFWTRLGVFATVLYYCCYINYVLSRTENPRVSAHQRKTWRFSRCDITSTAARARLRAAHRDAYIVECATFFSEFGINAIVNTTLLYRKSVYICVCVCVQKKKCKASMEIFCGEQSLFANIKSFFVAYSLYEKCNEIKNNCAYQQRTCSCIVLLYYILLCRNRFETDT